MTEPEGGSDDDKRNARDAERGEQGISPSNGPISGQPRQLEKAEKNSLAGSMASGGEVPPELDEKFRVFLESLSEAEREQFSSGSVEFSASYTHKGPLPPPHELAAYNQALPGGADRIVTMAEEQLRAAIRASDAEIQDSHRNTDAENWSLKATSFGVAYLPWALIPVTITLAILGLDTAAALSLAGTIGGGAVQLIGTIMGPRNRKIAQQGKHTAKESGGAK